MRIKRQAKPLQKRGRKETPVDDEKAERRRRAKNWRARNKIRLGLSKLVPASVPADPQLDIQQD